jgi:HSP90 family molecular chaperone
MKITALQAMGDSEKQSYMRGQKTLEINPYHPLIQELKTKVRGGNTPARANWRMLAGSLEHKATLRRMAWPLAHRGRFVFLSVRCTTMQWILFNLARRGC